MQGFYLIRRPIIIVKKIKLECIVILFEAVSRLSNVRFQIFLFTLDSAHSTDEYIDILNTSLRIYFKHIFTSFQNGNPCCE